MTGQLLGLASGWALAAAVIVAFSGRALGSETVAEAVWLSGLGLVPSFFLLHAAFSAVRARFVCAARGWLDAGADENAERLLRQGFESGLAHAEESVQAGMRLLDRFAAPNLVEGLRRAEVMAERVSGSDLAARLARLRAAVIGRS